jgi:hypothetical protein
MARFEVDLPHVAVVHTEDVRAFEAVFTGERNLELVPTADVLPAEAERARRRGSGRAPRTPRALAVRALQELPRWTATISGWSSQQIVKLAMGSAIPGSWVCLDSDAFFVAPLDERCFWADDTHLVLNALDSDVDYHPGPRRASAMLLGLKPVTVPSTRYYVDVPVVMDRAVVSDLLAFLERRSAGPWWRALVSARATEYMTYGLYAEHVDPGRVVPKRLDLSRLLYDVDASTILPALRAVSQGGCALAMVHSRLPLPAELVAEAAREAWAT